MITPVFWSFQFSDSLSKLQTFNVVGLNLFCSVRANAFRTVSSVSVVVNSITVVLVLAAAAVSELI